MYPYRKYIICIHLKMKIFHAIKLNVNIQKLIGYISIFIRAERTEWFRRLCLVCWCECVCVVKRDRFKKAWRLERKSLALCSIYCSSFVSSSAFSRMSSRDRFYMCCSLSCSIFPSPFLFLFPKLILLYYIVI